MKRAAPALLALSLIAMASAASAQTPPPAPPPPPTVPPRPSAAEIAARLPKARALVAITNPTDVMVDANMRGWEAGVAQVFVADPTASGIERQYPGAGRAAIEAARSLAREYCRRFVDEVNQYKASLLAERLTPAELDRATAFFASPAGRRLLQRMIRHADPAEVARDAANRAVQTGQTALSADRIRQMERDAARTTIGETSADDQRALLQFGRTSAAARYKEVSAEVDRFALDKANRPDPTWMRRQTDLVNQAIAAFVASRKTS